MIKITGPFPFWAYAAAPYVLLISAAVIGINSSEAAAILIGKIPLWCAYFLAVLSMWFCNGAVDTLKEHSE